MRELITTEGYGASDIGGMFSVYRDGARIGDIAYNGRFYLREELIGTPGNALLTAATILSSGSRAATDTAIQKMAYYSAQPGVDGQRRRDAIAHCEELGVDHTASSFRESV